MNNPQNRIYLDANATTPLLPEVFAAMRPWLLESFGNASSTHQRGQAARAAVDHARDQLAALLGCRATELVFTSGGTEADNLALFGTVQPGQHLITTTTEHHAVLHAAQALEKRGIDVTYLPCDPTGLISPAALEAALRPNTRLVSILFANNETGVLQPIAELARITKAYGARSLQEQAKPPLFHTDAVQAAGKLPLSLATDLRDVDLLSLSGHKLYAPQGTGALFVRRKTTLQPLFHGGPHERERRAGTENVAGIVALGTAAQAAARWLTSQAASTIPYPVTQGPGAPGLEFQTWVPNQPSNSPAELAALRDHLEQSLLAQIPNSGVNGTHAPRVSNTSNFFFDGLEAESLLIALDLAGIDVSAGSACSSGATEPSHVLLAMGLPTARARASIRISLSRLTTPAEIDQVLTLLPAAVARLRALDPAASSPAAPLRPQTRSAAPAEQTQAH